MDNRVTLHNELQWKHFYIGSFTHLWNFYSFILENWL